MQAFNTLAPVFFMLTLGYLARHKQWLTADQKAGANALIFTILFPILIFHLIMSAEIKASTFPIVLYIFIAFQLAMVLGKLLKGFIGKSHAHFAHFLLPTVEGGSVALPLYLSIVGVSSNTVIFDLAGAATAFLVIPILVSKASASNASLKELAISTITHPFLIAIGLGLVANAFHLNQLISHAPFGDAYFGIIEKATSPIVGTILFILGYDLQFDPETFKSIGKLLLVRVAIYSLIIAGFFLLFPVLMENKEFKIAVLLYFMCPTGFAMPAIIMPAFKSVKDELFSATFISLSLIVTLVVYTLLVVFMA
ncbi:AEC family transporter [Streptococcus parauberis]|uniref:AEC family transporter n=1 Tax=Streptococcus parauberis TaxID=1348 RepID=UPI000C1524E7|nr:AEC family transporter [Streptococcus parauberis]PIA85181.1 Membrane transport protein [Streptococcus parauberis]